MGNAWFQFKQFRVEQDRTALKVGTDACILGAWAKKKAAARILDIGTGTGLLALMLAQQHPQAIIDALEPEPQAAQQAQENFNSSPWNAYLHLNAIPVQEFHPYYQYELIVCNPPFYPKHLKTADKRRNMALHQDMLSFADLAGACSRLLAHDGLCYILLPPRQSDEFAAQALKEGLFLQQSLLIQDRPHLAVHRVVNCFAKSAAPAVETRQLIIRNEAGDYSPAYQALLKEYYLIF